MSSGPEPPPEQQADRPLEGAGAMPADGGVTPGADTTTGSGRGAQIGVDSWVAQSGERLDLGTGWQGALRRIDRRVGWWPKLAAAAAVGLIVGLLITNAGAQQVAFNSMVYAILSLGLNISVGWAGLLDLGYAAFYGMGAYGYALLASTALGTAGAGGEHLSAGVIILIVAVGVGLIGLLIGLVALRLEGDYLAIVTLFVGLAFTEVVTNVDPTVLGGVNGIFALDPMHVFGHQVTTTKGYYFVALGVVVVVAAILHLLDTSRTGRAWRALRDDPLAARAMTIPVNKLKVMAFAFGAMVGSVAGVLFAADQAGVCPSDFTISVVILIYACLVLGGAGSIAGAILGGVVITVGEQMLTSPTRLGLSVLRVDPRGARRQDQAMAVPGGGARRDHRFRAGGARDRQRDLTIGRRRPAGFGRLDRLAPLGLGDRARQCVDVWERPVRRPDRPAAVDHPAAGGLATRGDRADGLPGGLLLGVKARRQPRGHDSDHDRRDPDRDDGSTATGALGNPAGRDRVMEQGSGTGQPLLELDKLSLSFGGLTALSHVDLALGDREIVSIIGPNGAGKSTVFNVITGVYKPSSGDVRFAGNSIAGKRPQAIACLGIARTFQTLRLFLNMSVQENVKAATYGTPTRAHPNRS